MWTIPAIILASYLIGSIPTSIIVSKLFFGFDIRDYGSGNAGGTNAFRVMGWKAGIFVMAVDVAKGVIATYYFSQIRIDPVSLPQVYLQMIAGASAVIGHIWTIFAGFRGGKGVGTAAGMLIVLYPVAFLICLVVFAAVLLTTRYVSLSSMSAAITLPIALVILSKLMNRPLSTPLMILAVSMAILIVFTHRSNIQRLLQGNENRIKKIL
jgi:glycerol-3-phosphate acyltransferase PlsY